MNITADVPAEQLRTGALFAIASADALHFAIKHLPAYIEFVRLHQPAYGSLSDQRIGEHLRQAHEHMRLGAITIRHQLIARGNLPSQ